MGGMSSPRDELNIGDAVVPWMYTDAVEEYEAIRTGAALIDLSSCPLIRVAGPDTAIELGVLFTRELEYLSYETSAMGLFLTNEGDIVDMATVYRTEDAFLVEPSVGSGPVLLQHLHSKLDHLGIEVRSLADEFTVVALEGPRTWSAAEALLEVPVAGLPFQGVRPTAFAGRELLAARTGWTGEFGLKFFVPNDLVEQFWTAALEHATEVGHWALELAMLEVRQPILHRERHGDPSVQAAGYNWLVDLDKDEFLGREAIEGSGDPETRTVCFTTAATDVAAGDSVEAADRAVGSVVFAERHPTDGRTLGIARLDAAVAVSGLRLGLRTSSGVEPLATVSSPMTVPTSWGMIGASTE